MTGVMVGTRGVAIVGPVVMRTGPTVVLTTIAAVVGAVGRIAGAVGVTTGVLAATTVGAMAGVFTTAGAERAAGISAGVHSVSPV